MSSLRYASKKIYTKLIRDIKRIQQKLLDIQKRKGGISNGLYKRRFAKPEVIDITIILIKCLSYRNNYEAKGISSFISLFVYLFFLAYYLFRNSLLILWHPGRLLVYPFFDDCSPLIFLCKSGIPDQDKNMASGTAV